MLLAHLEWVGALCAVLTLVCAIQLILTGFLLWSIPDVLTLTKSHVPTLAGLIASFITLPAVIRFKTARMHPKMYTIYGYTLCYQRMTITVSTVVYVIALVLTINALLKTVKLEDDFRKLMRSYETQVSSKILVDNVQFLFQCCGGHTYADWFQNLNVKSTTETEVLLKDDDNYSVPYSCCSKSVLAPCNNRELEFGLGTINKGGCGHKLSHFVQTLLVFEIIFYGLSSILELSIVGLLTEAASGISDDIRSHKSFSNNSTKWESFANNNVSITSLWHSSHSEKKLSNKGKQ